MPRKNRIKKQVVENYVQPKPVSGDVHIKQKKLVGLSKIKKVNLTDKQKDLLQIIENNDIIIIYGPAGSSKTYIDCYYAIKSLENHSFEKIILTKPIQESGEKLGSLPGDVQQKILPHYESFRLNILNFIDKQNLEKLLKDEIIEFKPLTYMRGTGFHNSLMILDEAQNCDWKQIILFVTRMGKGSKVIISGDISQYDINKKMLALLGFAEMIKDIKGVSCFEFSKSDIQRHSILIEITERYEKLKYSNKIKEEK